MMTLYPLYNRFKISVFSECISIDIAFRSFDDSFTDEISRREIHINTVRYIKENAPDVDLVYLIDRARAPYGIKTEKELVGITSENIERLLDMGATRVLIACCTASTVHPQLSHGLKSISIPIVQAVADCAKNATRIGSIGVIATAHTVNSHAFKNALIGCDVYESAQTELVTLIDRGLCDASINAPWKAELEGMISPVLEKNIDTLVLGCTHFPALIKTIEDIARPYGVRSVIDSARIGAELIAMDQRKINR